MSEATRVRAFVSGVVQGVGFRYFAVGEAKTRGLTGWVRNRPDGSVEVLVEGEKGLVREYVSQLQVGPPGSRVSAVNMQPETFSGEFDTFAVRY
jgi:acylphosphatase